MKTQKFKQTEIGIIPEDWNVMKLYEICTRITDGSHFSPKESLNGKHIIATVKDMRYGRFDFSECKKISDEEFNNLKNNGCSPEKGDLLISKDGAKCLDIMFVYDSDEQIVLLSSIAIIRFKNTHNPQFYRYYLLSPIAQKIMKEGYVSGSAIPRVILSNFKKIPLPIPSRALQNGIVKILSDFDSKIELNQQMNNTLETIGQAIFKCWFIDSELVDRKMEELGDNMEFVKGKKPKDTSEVELDGYKKQILIENLNGVRSVYANPDNAVEVNSYDPIMVMDGASSGRIEIGHMGILGSTLAKIIPTNKRLSSFFIYYFLKSNETDINANTTGTSIPHTDKGRIKKLLFNYPTEEQLKIFDSIAKEILDKIIQNKKETSDLLAVRDSLLPKLMSGRIRVAVDDN